MSFGSPAYAYATYNMAVSIKRYSPDTLIGLIHDSNVNYLPSDWRDLFDNLEVLKPDDYLTDNKLDPGKAKVSVYNYLPYKHNLCLDVDGILLKDIEPLFETLIEDERNYLCESHGSGLKSDKINYSIWAKHEDIWQHFNVDEDTTFHAIQTSLFYVKKCAETKKLFQYALSNYNFPMDKLTHRWGGTMPDELIISGSLAHFKLNPDMGMRAVFFGNENTDKPDEYITDNFYILSIYGNGEGRTLTKLRFLKLYSKLVIRLADIMGKRFYKHELIMGSKHAGKRGTNHETKHGAACCT